MQDRRPDSRTQVVWSNAYRHFITDLDAALHVDMRLYDDDFGINSLTLEMAWVQNLGNSFHFIPRVRYYSQSAADFFTPINDFTGTLMFNSSDYRLWAYGAVSGGIQARAVFDDITLTFNLERYITDSSYSLFDGDSSPALVDFSRLSLGFGYSF